MRRALLLAALALVAACVEKGTKPRRRARPDAALPEHVQGLVLDAEGRTTLSLAGTVLAGFDAGDADGRVLAHIQAEQSDGGRRLIARAPGGGGDVAFVAPDGEIRLVGGERRGQVAREDTGAILFMDARNVPIVRLDREGDAVIVRDPAGGMVGKIYETGGRLVIENPDGSARGYVTGVKDAMAAGLLSVPGVAPLDRALAGAWALSRGY